MRRNQLYRFTLIKRIFIINMLMVMFIGNMVVFPVHPISSIYSIAAEAASGLANVKLLTVDSIEAELTEREQDDHYQLALSLTGRGAADVELVKPDRMVIFYIPELAGKLAGAESAHVSVEILPLTIEDLPGLNTEVGALTNTAAELVTGLTSGLDAAINDTLIQGLVEVKGLAELKEAVEELNNLDQALQDLTAYNDQIPVQINEDGLVSVDFSDGLGNHLETAVKDTVQPVLENLLSAVDGIEVSLLSILPGLSELLNKLVLDPIVNPLKSAVTEAVNSLTAGLTDGTIDLANELAAVQLIGNTSVHTDVKVVKPAGVKGDVIVYGAGVQDKSAIDIELMSRSEDKAVITFPFIAFHSVPEEIAFQTTVITPGLVRVPRQDPDWSLEVIDTRGPGSTFRILAKAENPLATVDGNHQLPDALVFIDEESRSHSLSAESVIVYDGATGDNEITAISWEADKGLLVEVDAGNARAGSYSTTISWTLIDAP